MEEAGVDNLDELRVEGDWTAASGKVGFHSLYAQAPDVEAVFACNDQMALGVLQAARHLGLDVPQDLAVVGFDDIPEAAFFCPSLTTVRQNPKKLGALAVEQMNRLIRAHQRDEDHSLGMSDSAPGMSWVKPRLIVRKSSIKE